MRFRLFSVFILATLCAFLHSQTIVKDIIIWKGKPYAAFTSLAYFNGYYYCAFREAKNHADLTGENNGIIHVIRSIEGNRWQLFQTFSKDGHDLRDPQLCVTPTNQLLLTAEDVVYRNNEAVYRKTISAIKIGKKQFSDLRELMFSPTLSWNWLWQTSIVNGKVCGFTYCPYFAFSRSKDGLNFEVENPIKGLNIPTEASVVYFTNKIIALARTNGNAVLGICEDGVEWRWQELNIPISCPKLIVYKDMLYCIGRTIHKNKNFLQLFNIDIENNYAESITEIHSGKDNAYPGAVIVDDVLCISYYSGDGKNSNIHFAKVKLN